MSGVHQLADRIGRFLLHDFGLLGLFLVAFADSSFLSLPEVNDLLVVTLAIADPDRFWLYALVATLGSVTGCAALHTLGKKGGQAVLRRGFSPERIAKLQATFRRFDLLAVLVPSLLPPPCPFKVFVLASGVFGMSYTRALTALLVGRSLRYVSEAWLAVRFGRQFLAYAEVYAYELALSVLLVLLGAWLLRRMLHRRAQRATPRGESTPSPAALAANERG